MYYSIESDLHSFLQQIEKQTNQIDLIHSFHLPPSSKEHEYDIGIIESVLLFLSLFNSRFNIYPFRIILFPIYIWSRFKSNLLPVLTISSNIIIDTIPYISREYLFCFEYLIPYSLYQSYQQQMNYKVGDIIVLPFYDSIVFFMVNIQMNRMMNTSQQWLRSFIFRVLVIL